MTTTAPRKPYLSAGFFMLLNLFGGGILLFFAAGSFDLMIGGWEVVGVTSILLIAFFQHRDDPINSALRVFATYRACDVGLLTGVVLMHIYVGTSEFTEVLPNNIQSHTPLLGGSATLVAVLLLLAAMGKAAQVPFSGWLPRAMEGPTPSSARAGNIIRNCSAPFPSRPPQVPAC